MLLLDLSEKDGEGPLVKAGSASDSPGGSWGAAGQGLHGPSSNSRPSAHGRRSIQKLTHLVRILQYTIEAIEKAALSYGGRPIAECSWRIRTRECSSTRTSSWMFVLPVCRTSSGEVAAARVSPPSGSTGPLSMRRLAKCLDRIRPAGCRRFVPCPVRSVAREAVRLVARCRRRWHKSAGPLPRPSTTLRQRTGPSGHCCCSGHYPSRDGPNS